MADFAQALHAFWSGFGWTAYDQYTVPSQDLNPAMPRITYEVSESDFDRPISLDASLWDRGYSWANITAKAEEIFYAIGYGGIQVPFDDGFIWIKRGQPFSQRMADEDDSIRRILLQVEAEFLRV